MMNALVSVNITTHNRSDMLPRCLNSVISQTYNNLEIIVVDDASVDNTKDLVSNYISKDERIKYIRHSKNRGNAATRNTAWKNSRGDYIAFMDDDDAWIDENKLLKQLDIFQHYDKGNIGIVCSSVLLREQYREEAKIIKKPKHLNSILLKGNGIIYSPTVLAKNEVLIKTNGFDENLYRGIDAEFFRNAVCVHGYNVYFMQDVTTLVNREDLERLSNFSSNIEKTKKSLTSFQYLYNKNKNLFLKYSDVNAYWLEIISKHFYDLFLLTEKKEYLNACIHYLYLSMRSKITKKTLRFIAKLIVTLTMRPK
jgi:glycosyltransferase involved in cell wall biosynthesis